jgi:hypothetical protein
MMMELFGIILLVYGLYATDFSALNELFSLDPLDQLDSIDSFGLLLSGLAYVVPGLMIIIIVSIVGIILLMKSKSELLKREDKNLPPKY